MISPSPRADFAVRAINGIVQDCCGGLFRRRLIGLSLGFLRRWLACTRNRLAGVFQVFQALVELLFVSVATAAGANRKNCQESDANKEPYKSQHALYPAINYEFSISNASNTFHATGSHHH